MTESELQRLETLVSGRCPADLEPEEALALIAEVRRLQKDLKLWYEAGCDMGERAYAAEARTTALEDAVGLFLNAVKLDIQVTTICELQRALEDGKS